MSLLSPLLVSRIQAPPLNFKTGALPMPTNSDIVPRTIQPGYALGITLVGGRVGISESEQVLKYLAAQEFKEPEAWLRDDIRIAWLTVLHAADDTRVWSKGSGPWEYSFWSYLGQHPDKLIPQFVARAEQHRLMEIPDYDPTIKFAGSMRRGSREPAGAEEATRGRSAPNDSADCMRRKGAGCQPTSEPRPAPIKEAV